MNCPECGHATKSHGNYGCFHSGSCGCTTKKDKLLYIELSIYRDALQYIRDNYGKVCNEFETCDHLACESSYGAWAEADKTLRESMDEIS